MGRSMSGFWLKWRSEPHSFYRGFPEKKVDEESIGGCSIEASENLKMDMDHLKGCPGIKKRRSPKVELHNSLKQEILQLETRLQSQFEVRHALEKALSYRSSLRATSTNESSITKPATELVREIAVLELEVVYLEQYLLSLYRKTLNERVPTTNNEQKSPPLSTPRERFSQNLQPVAISKKMNSSSQVNSRCHSSLSQQSSAKALRACHSQPLSMTEYAQSTPNLISLAEHLGTRISDHVLESPTRIAEDMVKCMSSVYCKLADPPLTNPGLSSPSSSLSSVSGFSPRDIWSPGFRNNSSFDVRLDNPFHVEGLKEFSGPYSTMLEVSWIYRDSRKLGDVDHLLQDYRSLISRLEEVNPRKLNREEKVAFWINIHNALVMHAFLAYGIPQNNMKRVFLLLKAAYNVGGVTVSADTIRSSILGCRSSRHGQWIRLLISSKTKFKTGDQRKTYGIEHHEPLSHFGLCSGSHSDPAVRVYTPKRVLQELEVAKEEYIRATFGIRKDKKILLPKIVESFAKDAGLCEAGLMEMIQESLPESLRKSVKRHNRAGMSKKSVEWVAHNLSFRYLIAKELVK